MTFDPAIPALYLAPGFRPLSAAPRPVVDPARLEEVGRIAETTWEEAEAVLRAVGAAQGAWKRLDAKSRAKALHDLASRIEAADHRPAAILMSREMGKPYPEAIGEIANCAPIFRYYAEMARDEAGKVAGTTQAGSFQHARYEPYGVSVHIMPFNFPVLLMCWTVAASLAAGNACVIKPAPATTLSTLEFMKMFSGLPEGLVACLPGGAALAEALIASPLTHAVAFTGSVAAGRAVGAAAAAVAAAPAAPVADTSPDWPAGTAMKTMTVREALREAMAEEMVRDGDVYLMGEEVGEYQGAYKISQGLLDQFGPKRVVDTPITEHGFAGIAVGSAFGGLRPIVEFMTFNFAMQAIDQIINSAAKTLYMSGGQMGCPIVFRGPNGAAARVGAQHSQDYAAWYAMVPGLKVVMPYSAADAKGLLKTAIRDPNPVIFLENEILYGRSFEVPDLPDFTIPFGKAKIWREGTDVTLVSFGIGVSHALEAADKLAKDGISAEVIDLRTLRPMDTATVITSVMKTNRCVTVEEGWPVGSIGGHISSVLMQEAFDYLDAPVITCTGKDVPMPYAANLEKLALITSDEIVAAVKKVTYR